MVQVLRERRTMPRVLRVWPNGMVTMQMLLALMGKQIRIPANSPELASKNLVLTSQTVKPQPMIPLR